MTSHVQEVLLSCCGSTVPVPTAEARQQHPNHQVFLQTVAVFVSQVGQNYNLLANAAPGTAKLAKSRYESCSGQCYASRAREYCRCCCFYRDARPNPLASAASKPLN